MVADSHICHELSTSWQVIQPEACEGQNKYFVCRSFLNFGCLFLTAASLAAGQLATWNIPGHCRLLRVPCIMRPAVQHSLPQALCFQMCPLFQRVRYTMDCHSQKQSSWMRRSKQQRVLFFYWTCKYFIVNCSGTWFSRCAHESLGGSLCT